MRLRAVLILGIVGLLGAFILRRNSAVFPSRSPKAGPQNAGRSGPFEDAAQRAGLTFRYYNGHKGIATILEESGSGCAIFDYDGDSRPDLYLLNGRDLYGRGVEARNALYHNNGDGTFTDVTERAGVPGTGYGLGVAAADYDNDGHPDIYIGQWGKNCLYRNNGNGTFTDVTDRAGVGALDYGGRFHTGVAWLDYDHDGLLDLFAGSYVHYRPDGLRYCKLPDGVLSNCPPAEYDGTPSLLFHNNGNGTFTNVTRQAHVYFPRGKALSAITCDPDDDGWTDLIVGNDGEPAWLLHNNRNGTFTDIGPAAGIAYAQDSATMAAMGIDLGDYLNEGRPGFFVADFSKRPHHLWRSLSSNVFAEVSTPSGIADATFAYLGFGSGFFDYDNDGWLDLFEDNGHVYPEVDHPGSDQHYLQPNQLFHNEHNGTFRETTREAGPGFALLHAARGAAFGDYDNDGFMDILVNNNDGPPVLLHNRGKQGTHFVNFLLVGAVSAKSNRDAIGARVRVTTGGVWQMRDVKSGGSYLSSSDPRLHFGVGAASTIDLVEVRWPSGDRQTFKNLPADMFYLLKEGAPAPSRQR